MQALPPNIVGDPCRLPDDGEDERRATLAALQKMQEAMTNEELRTLAELCPMLTRAFGSVPVPQIAGQPIASHSDYRPVVAVANASNEYLQGIANRHGIPNITQDNGIRVLQIALACNLGVVPGRTGNDLYDRDGQEFELKTCSLDGRDPGFTTAHHLTRGLIEKYRKAGFIFAAFSGGRLISVYVVHPKALSDYFDAWENGLRDGKDHHNNRIIPINHVREIGTLINGDALPDDWKALYAGKEAETLEKRDPETLGSLAAALALSEARFNMKKTRKAFKQAFKAIEVCGKTVRRAAKQRSADNAGKNVDQA